MQATLCGQHERAVDRRPLPGVVGGGGVVVDRRRVEHADDAVVEDDEGHRAARNGTQSW